MRLLIATHNRGKLIEFQELLAGLPLALATLDDVGIREDVEETGTTFASNARLKALVHARSSGLLTLADDSGLEVGALGGEPGIYSRRYAGEGASDDQRINFLLYKIKDVPAEARRARFRCAIAIASPSGETWETEGTVDGELLFAPRGTNGFGYDPIFFFPKLGLTMAELPPAEKNKISHRARAAEGAREILEKIILPRERKSTDNTGDEA